MTLVKPLEDDELLSKLSDIDNSELAPEFVKQTQLFKKRVFSKNKAKSLDEKLITGEVLVNLAEQYVESFNTGSLPNIERAQRIVFDQVCSRAVQQSFDEFKFAVESRLTLPCTPLDLEIDYGIGKKVSMELFKALAIGGPVAEAELKLKKQMKDAYDHLKDQNAQACQVVCN